MRVRQGTDSSGCDAAVPSQLQRSSLGSGGHQARVQEFTFSTSSVSSTCTTLEREVLGGQGDRLRGPVDPVLVHSGIGVCGVGDAAADGRRDRQDQRGVRRGELRDATGYGLRTDGRLHSHQYAGALQAGGVNHAASVTRARPTKAADEGQTCRSGWRVSTKVGG